ncbi:MAG: carbohydrate ABC transporter permease, partial [Lachnospiraceae bacterium]|nr:carbohydrate ABC transporter permease [Lachnospiraceae bacterium]
MENVHDPQKNPIEKKIDRSKAAERLRKVIVYAGLTVWAVLVLFPFYWMLLTSVESYGEYNGEHVPKFYAKALTVQNYVDAFQSVPLGRYLFNTLLFTVITTAIMLIVATLAAYGFA